MRTRLWFCQWTMLVICFMKTVSAAWQQTAGPYGAVVNTLFVNGNNIFAGTDAGVFLSTDNGATWSMRNTGQTWYFHATSFASAGSNLFLGNSDGVYLSTDNGANWALRESGLTDDNVTALVYDGADLFAGTSSGVFRSTDGGAGWSPVNTGLTNTQIHTLFSVGSFLFAGTWNGGVFRSTNKGSNWTAVNTGLTDLRVEAPGQSQKRALLGVRNAVRGELTVVTSATKRSTDFICLLQELDKRYALSPGESRPPVVLVLDNGPIHTSKASTKALAERPWIRVEWLPKYAPELNDIERDWRHLKMHFLANQVVEDVDDLDRRIHAAVAEINHQRTSTVLHEMQHAA